MVLGSALPLIVIVRLHRCGRFGSRNGTLGVVAGERNGAVA
jgi:hypothetical protein